MNNPRTFTVYRDCVRFEPRERPAMGDIVKRLEKMLENLSVLPNRAESDKYLPILSLSFNSFNKSLLTINPWHDRSPVATALETFASRLKFFEARVMLRELRTAATELLGAEAVSVMSGVYNDVKLFRILCASDMDVQDATSMLLVNANARKEFGILEKRREIVSKGVSYSPEVTSRPMELNNVQIFTDQSLASQT